MSSAAASAPATPAPSRPLSLGVIFLTLYIDLIGFSIGFPLGPDLLAYYLKLEGHAGALGWMLAHLDTLAHALGKDTNFAAVLFGGVISSVFSILQFVFAPFWGSLSDRMGRRGILRWTVAGTALSYLLWVVSGSFWLFIFSRLVSGAFSGNLSVATAAVADLTTRAERSRAMGLVGAAFGLGLVTGPAIGAFTAPINLLTKHPDWARFGINPFSVPALIAFVMCLINLVWISARFKETLSPEARAAAHEPRLRNPLRAILMLDNQAVRQANIVALIFSMAFVAMESTLTFLAFDRFGYDAKHNGYLLGFLGFVAILTQGYIVRKLLKKHDELPVLTWGLAAAGAGLLCIGFAPQVWVLYAGLAVLALGSGLVNPSTSGLISLYSNEAEQGRMLGIFRSLGSLSRAYTPMLASLIYWVFGAKTLFAAAAGLTLLSIALSSRLPKPVK